MKTIIKIIAGIGIIFTMASCDENHGVDPALTPDYIEVKVNEPFTIYINNYDKRWKSRGDWMVRSTDEDGYYHPVSYEIVGSSREDSIRLYVTESEPSTFTVDYMYTVTVPLVPASHPEIVSCTVHVIE